MRKSMLLVAALIAGCEGCGSLANDDNHGYGFGTDAVGASGLRLRFMPEPYDPAWGYMEYMEQAFTDTQACTGITAPAPFVVVATANEMQTSTGHAYFDPPLIVVRDGVLVLKHEYVHYLLHASGFSDRANARHDSPLFALCGQEFWFKRKTESAS